MTLAAEHKSRGGTGTGPGPWQPQPIPPRTSLACIRGRLFPFFPSESEVEKALATLAMCRGRRWPTCCCIPSRSPAVPPSPCFRSSGLNCGPPASSAASFDVLKPLAPHSESLIRGLGGSRAGRGWKGRRQLFRWMLRRCHRGVPHGGLSPGCFLRPAPTARCRTVRDLPLPSRTAVGSESAPPPRVPLLYST